MTDEQKADIRYLIAFYDWHGWDWSNALEYEVRKYNNSLPHQERWPNTPRNKRVKDNAKNDATAAHSDAPTSP